MVKDFVSGPSSSRATAAVREKAPLILAEIQKAKNVLLHCHPSPDPDSVGSALAMKLAVEQLGKKATVIKGDSDIPAAFAHFPGVKDIVMKSWWEIDPKEFDLFIIVDSALGGVSREKPVVLPAEMRSVNIDHHRTNEGSGDVNLIDPSYPANAQLLADLFMEMGVEITHDIAANLLVGIYTDTGGFKYEGVASSTFVTAAHLIALVPDFPKLVSEMENSSTLDDLRFQGLALSSIEIALDGKVALSVVEYNAFQAANIPDVSISAGMVSSILRRAGQFDIVGAILEPRPGKVKLSFRSRDGYVYDVSKLAAALGGGGHKAAAGVAMEATVEEAKEKVLATMKELFKF